MVDHAPPPARVTLKRITVERVKLYSYIPSPGTNIPISVQPFPVDDFVPLEEEIEWSVTRLRNHRSGGVLVMRAEHLKRWLAVMRKADKDATTAARVETMDNRGDTSVQPTTDPTEAYNWEMVKDLIYMAFREGKLTEEATW